MTTSATRDFPSETAEGRRIPNAKLGYFEARLSGLVHQALLWIFGRFEREQKLTRRNLAHRIGRKPEQITRWLSYPSNLTLSTVSNLLLGAGYEVTGVVLADLATGKKLSFPEQSASDQQVSFSALERLEPERSIVVRPPDDADVGNEDTAPHGAANAALLYDTRGKAESAQLKNRLAFINCTLAEASR